MVNASDHIETPTRDSPPHLTGHSIFGIPKSECSKELSTISKPVYEDKLLENIHIAPYHSNIIPGSFTFRHVNQMVAKAWIIKAFELGFNHLGCNKLKVLEVEPSKLDNFDFFTAGFSKPFWVVLPN